MERPLIIESLDEFSKKDKGWTYFLISSDNRYLKIGKTVSNIEWRISWCKNDRNYKDKKFRFLMAVEGADLERHFLSFFSSYRANIIWESPENKIERLTSDEAWALAIKLSKKIHGVYRKNEVSHLYWKYTRKTIVELFKIPPKKLAPNLSGIIIRETIRIHEQNS